MMCGDREGLSQHSYELKRPSTKFKEEIATLAGLKHDRAIVRKYDMMALKSATGLSWKRMTAWRWMLNKLGIKYSSEKEEKVERREVLELPYNGDDFI